jgi:DNA-binding MurR/RpiR family transcriptional regulator
VELSVQQRAARFVLERREDVALLRTREVACHAGVQPTTIIRPANRLGYPDDKSFCERLRCRTARGGRAALAASEADFQRCQAYWTDNKGRRSTA